MVAPPYVTYAIIAANVAVYLAMGASGVSWTQPSIPDAIRWGADFGPLTLNGQWWRLFTSTFVHFGILHIAFNMWCLLDLGRSLEFFMGRKAFAATYVVSGIAASTVSLWWRPLSVSAGASGAIFGIAGAFASYIFLKRVDLIPQALKRIRGSLAFFIIVNLAWGAASIGIDNSAHLGGLIAGAILGAVVPPVIARRVRPGPVDVVGYGPSLESARKPNSGDNRTALAIVLGSALVLIAALSYVRKDHAAYADYGQAVVLLRAGHFDQAIGALNESVQKDGNFILTNMLLGETFLEQANPSAAVAPLERAIRLDASDLQNDQNLALSYIGTGQYQLALGEIGNVISAEKNEPGWDAVFIRSVAEGQSGDYASATRDLEAVNNANPKLSAGQTDLLRFEGLENGRPESALPPLAVPYSQLVARSNDWPFLP